MKRALPFFCLLTWESTSPFLQRRPLGWSKRTSAIRVAGFRQWQEQESGEKRSICVLPFEVPELLMPGQTRYLNFYEARFLKLGEKSQNEHFGMIAMAFFSGGEGAMLRVCTLVQIDEYAKLEVGVGLTVRAVGRCNIENIISMDEYIVAEVSAYEDEEDENENEMPGHEGQSAQLLAHMYKIDENLISMGRESCLDVSAKELKQDPRSILLQGENLVQAVERVERQAKVASQESLQPGTAKERDTMAEDASDEGVNTSLSARVALARAAQTGSIALQPRNEEEKALELMLASFIGLEGATIQKKLQAFLSQNLQERLEMACDALEERRKLVTAKRSLMNLFGGASSSTNTTKNGGAGQVN